MELPKRAKHDQYTRPGQYGELQERVRRQVDGQDIPILFVYAFDMRTRVGPFLFFDKWLVPGSPRAVAAALNAAGFTNTRVVMHQWNPNIRPSQALVGGKPPEVLFVSSMQIHSTAAYRLIQDAWSLGDERPLIFAGGAKAIYEPWDFFGMGQNGDQGADVAVTGEEFVILELLDRIVQHKLPSETMRQAFTRVRNSGLLDDIPGLVYRPEDEPGPPEHLINTGIQRLVQNLDELPMTHDAMRMFEPPHRRATLSSRPMKPADFRRHACTIAIVTTHGCKFRCSYCPIPAYNQMTFRYKSPERLVEEMAGIVKMTGVHAFFGTDDNFFNSRETAEEILTTMARGDVDGVPFRDSIHFATEATEFDVHKNEDLMPLAREAGLQAIWFGIEDMTAHLVKKGQTPEKTESVFKLLNDLGIAAHPMMMHHDGQPLWTRQGLYGLLNQVRYLRQRGAMSMQVTFLTPMIGTKGYEQPYDEGMVLRHVGSQFIDDHKYDGNHCIATHDRPWRKELNMILAYASFYNPLNWTRALLYWDQQWKNRVIFQTLGNLGVINTLAKKLPWVGRLMTNRIERHTQSPRPKLPMVVPDHVDTNLAHYELGFHLPVVADDEPEFSGTHEGCHRGVDIARDAAC